MQHWRQLLQNVKTDLIMVLLWQKQNDIGKMVFAINAKITLATGEVLYDDGRSSW